MIGGVETMNLGSDSLKNQTYEQKDNYALKFTKLLELSSYEYFYDESHYVGYCQCFSYKD